MTSPARAILDAKLALEQEVQRPILSVCTRYIEVWVQSQGHIPAIDRLMALTQLEKVLLRHYARTVMVMTGRRPPKDPQLHVAVRSLRHMDSLRSRAKHQAMLILRGLDRELAAGMVEPGAIGQVDDGTTNYGKGGIDVLEAKADSTSRVYGVTAAYVGKLRAAAVSTISKLKSKIKTVAGAQTQPVAEEARIEVVPPQNANGRLLMVWRTCRDDRVRHPPSSHFDHVTAEGQERYAGDSFDVSDESLRFPGDTSLGASLGNIINCRCWLETFFEPNDGAERRLIHVAPSSPTRRYTRPGAGKPATLRATSTVTLNGTTNARVVLGDSETIATLRQPSPSRVEVLLNRRVVARAQIVNGRAVNVTVESSVPQGLDIEGLIRRSVEHSSAR